MSTSHEHSVEEITESPKGKCHVVRCHRRAAWWARYKYMSQGREMKHSRRFCHCCIVAFALRFGVMLPGTFNVERYG